MVCGLIYLIVPTWWLVNYISADGIGLYCIPGNILGGPSAGWEQ